MTNFSKFAITAVATLALGAAGSQAQSGDNRNRVVDVRNESSLPIFHLYISNVSNGGWGPDQLEIFQTIGVDRYRTFNMDDGSGHCLYDIKAVLSDGREAVTRRFNVCANDTWTVVDE